MSVSKAVISLPSYDNHCRHAKDIRGLKSGRQFIEEARMEARILTRPFIYVALILLALGIGSSLSGCCTVSLRPELTHVSHLTQHFQTEYDQSLGYNEAALDLHIEPVRHLMIDVSEGMILERQQHYGGVPFAGALEGPRETFQGTIAWDIPLRR
jgi:hypothetical protein